MEVLLPPSPTFIVVMIPFLMVSFALFFFLPYLLPVLLLLLSENHPHSAWRPGENRFNGQLQNRLSTTM